MKQDHGYAPASTHENSDGLRSRFARVNPDWNRRPAHLESRAEAYDRITRRDGVPEPIWQRKASNEDNRRAA